MMIQSLIIFGQRSDLEQLLDEETISNFVVETLENLSLTTQYDIFKEIFFRFLPNLVLDVGLNLIKTTETERQQMYDDPQEFINLALDTCDKQQSNVVKTQAAKLFEGLCDNIDGAVTVTSYFCI
jgi:chaperonin cofactor prefoldin